MRFMVFMIPNRKDYEGGAMPSPEAIAAMGKFNQELVTAGVLLSLDGLQPPSMGARIEFPGGKAKQVDAAANASKDVIGGYWLLQVKSREEAVQWAMRCPADAGQVLEVRRVFEMEDFTPSPAVDDAYKLDLPGKK